MTTILSAGLSQLPRILGLIDRDPTSKTYGCCDRSYWHYKVIDFPNARLQEAALVLSLAKTTNCPENWAFRSSTMSEWVRAIINFWALRRHHDGSTDESYPFERHFCSTAFSLYSVTESLLVLKEDSSWDFIKTAHFLSQHDNRDVANQMACAAAALYNVFLLTSKDEFRSAFEKELSALLSMQDKTGAFCEYGGFDLGYDSITLNFLADIFKKTNREDVAKSADFCIKNLRHHLDEDGYFSSNGMSRQTQFLYPYGFSVFAPDIIKRMEEGIRKNIILQPAWMDDRYCIPMAANYIKTGQEPVGS